MGKRGSIQFKYENGKSIYFYSHWKGDRLAEMVQRALKREKRWDDESYLARIVFCELVKGQESEETGFGISPYIIEEGSPLVIIQPSIQSVIVDKTKYTFAEFIRLERVPS